MPKFEVVFLTPEVSLNLVFFVGLVLTSFLGRTGMPPYLNSKHGCGVSTDKLLQNTRISALAAHMDVFHTTSKPVLVVQSPALRLSNVYLNMLLSTASTVANRIHVTTQRMLLATAPS